MHKNPNHQPPRMWIRNVGFGYNAIIHQPLHLTASPWHHRALPQAPWPKIFPLDPTIFRYRCVASIIPDGQPCKLGLE